MKTKPGIFPTSAGFSSWLMALAIVAVAFYLGWNIYSAAQRIGNPFQRVAQEISNVAK